MRLAYLYSRYPVLSQTFCDTEMIALERMGFFFIVGSIHSPLTSIRHAHSATLNAPVFYAPPSPIMRLWEEKTRDANCWPETLIARHEQQYGSEIKAALRARNAAYFADLFKRNQIDHVHVHFANRAAHTALFLKAISGIPFSVTAHGQDFMADLGSDDLLREICAAAEFVAVETEYSRGLMAERCPDSAAKIHCVYNGMNLANFPAASMSLSAAKPVRILSIGRLVAFKGFEYLIEACEQLRQRSINFSCEIVGDGPLRQSLQEQIDALRLRNFVILTGALPQEDVFQRLQCCDIFALASTIDDRGASDIFPTVILEAMASSRAVVSTDVAGIPEAVVDKETGLLVPGGESGLFADALETLCRNGELGTRYGAAGRQRIENHFQVEKTVQPLIKLFEKLSATQSATTSSDIPDWSARTKIAYLIDRWPDNELPFIERELFEVRKYTGEVKAFVCEFDKCCRLTTNMKRLALDLEFLPDLMAIEAEWQSNRILMLALEEDWANRSVREPADLFLRQARFAITLRRMFRGIGHVHATSSRALLCGVMLKKILGISLSASIELKPDLPIPVIESALQHAVGGRLASRALSKQIGAPFIFDRAAGGRRGFGRMLRRIMPQSRISLTRAHGFWQEWSGMLDQWRAATSEKLLRE